MSVSVTGVDRAEITWTTDVPASTQVVLMDVEYQPHSRFPEPSDKTLVTAHSVVLTDLVPGSTYWFYVVSQDGSGALMTTYDPRHPASFKLPPADPSAPFAYRVRVTGPRTVYAGHDLYLSGVAISLGGDLGHVFFGGMDDVPQGITTLLMCDAVDPTPLNDADDNSIDATSHKPYCYVNANQFTRGFMVRISVPGNVAPGTYNAALHFIIKGIEQLVTIPITILPIPQPVIQQPLEAVPPIPNLRKWEDTMTYLGAKWCHPTEIMKWGYEPQIWYYDGARTYFQIADYTKDPSTWNPCATNIVNQYRDRIIQRNGQYEGWRVFPHGLAMNYWRTGDEKSREAAIALSKSSAFAHSGGRVSVAYIRETAYIIEAYVIAEQLGEPRNPYLARAVDFGLGHFDQMFVSNPASFDQLGFDGLMAEALIQYYALTKDPRIPPAIKTMLDWIWENAYDSRTHSFAYNSVLVPQSYTTVQSNLILPAYAWYWNLTHDPVYLQRGDELFAHALDTNIDYSGKIFNQNYRWSFDYVRWRSNEPTSTTEPEANTPASVAAVQNRPPVVNAGADLAITWPVNSATLTGSATDADGSIVSQVWSMLSGPGTVSFSNPNALSTAAQFSSPGQYVLALTASDGLTSTTARVMVSIGSPWYQSNWTKRHAFTIHHSKVAGNLSGFPVLISVVSDSLKSTQHGGNVALPTGADLVFTDGANSKIPYEIEKYDPKKGELIAWVRCNLSASVDTTIYLYFSNAAAVGQDDQTGVWDADYRAVWHLDQEHLIHLASPHAPTGKTTARVIPDSTKYENHASAAQTPAASSGMIGDGRRFDGQHSIAAKFASSLRLGNRFTWEAWIKSDGFKWPGSMPIFGQGPAGSGPLPPTMTLNSTFQLQVWILKRGLVAATSPDVLSAGHWYHVVYSRDGIGATNHIFVNGSPLPLTFNASTTNLNFTDATGMTYIGGDAQGHMFKGWMDEIRVSSIARSAEWIATEYNNESDPSSFYTVSGPEDRPPGL